MAASPLTPMPSPAGVPVAARTVAFGPSHAARVAAPSVMNEKNRIREQERAIAEAQQVALALARAEAKALMLAEAQMLAQAEALQQVDAQAEALVLAEAELRLESAHRLATLLAEATPKPDDDRTLAQMAFSDLMIWPDGSGFLRQGPALAGTVMAVPKGGLHDVMRILEQINSIERDSTFLLLHDAVPYRVARIETRQGTGFFLRRPAFPVPSLDGLGLPPPVLGALREIGKRSGLVLVAGAAGSGKSTTLHAYLTELVSHQGDIVVALEDPPEVPVQGVYGEHGQGLWFQIDASESGGYQAAVAQAMRYNPRYLLLGDIRTPEAACAAMRAAMGGHLVVTTMAGCSLPGTLAALLQLAATGAGSAELARTMLADSLAAVVLQKWIPEPLRPGRRKLQVDMLCLGHDPGMRSKVRDGKLEQLSSDIETQRLRIERGQLPVDFCPRAAAVR